MIRFSDFFSGLAVSNSHGRRGRKSRPNNAVRDTECLEQRALLSIEPLSLTDGDTTGDDRSDHPQISRDGRFVAFQSRADDLALDTGFDSNGFRDIFVSNIEEGTTTLISVNPGGRSGDADSWLPSISDDGRFVAFMSFAEDLVGDITITTDVPNVFVHDRDSDENGVYDEPGATRIRLLSVDAVVAGESGNGPSGGGFTGPGWPVRPVISGDGGQVVYGSSATNLLDPDDGVTVTFGGQLYVSPTGGGPTRLVSVDSTGTTSGIRDGGGTAGTPSISGDGRYIAFRSNFTNLVDDDTEEKDDIFLRDTLKGTTTRVSVAPDGKGGNRLSREPVISRNGRHVVFTSLADNLVAGDTNVGIDRFVYNTRTKRNTAISVSRDPTSGSETGDVDSAGLGIEEAGYAISDNGRYVLFTSGASDLLDPSDGITDDNGALDVFLFDRDADSDGTFDELSAGGTTTELVTINAAGTAATDVAAVTGGSSAVSITGDGRFAVFTSPGEDLVTDPSAGAGIYIRDLFAKATQFIAPHGTPSALQAGAAESGIAASPLRVAFSSAATDVVPSVTDGNGELDLFVYTAPADIRFRSAKASDDVLAITYRIANAPADAPFEIGVYLSTDGTFDAGTDKLLDTITIDGSDLDVGGRQLAFDIGGGPGEIALPGAGADEVDFDYQILFVMDHLDTQDELDADPFNDDNTGRFQGLYHLAGGPLFYHGRLGTRLEDDVLTVVEVDGSTLEVTLNDRVRTYDPADVTSIRFRGHEGRDVVQTAGTDDLLLGGAGRDVLRGGAGDDTIGGGLGDDRLLGEAGFDTIFDGMDDDYIDLGLDGGVIVATPGSDDIFLGLEDNSVLDFSFADHGIVIDLDSSATQTVDDDDNTVTLNLGNRVFDFTGSGFDDDLFFTLKDGDRVIRGGDGNDRITIDADGRSVTFDGTKLIPEIGGSITLIDFEDIDVFNFPPVIIDNSDVTGFSDDGFFDSDPNFPQGFNGGVKFSGADSGNTAGWTFTDITPGRYVVSTTWTNAPDRASNSPFTIFDGAAGGTIASQVDVNQELPPDEFDDGGISWRNLDIVDVTGTTLTVQLSDVDADEFVVADAVRIEPLAPNSLIFDDLDPQFDAPDGIRVDGPGLFGGATSQVSNAGGQPIEVTLAALADSLRHHGPCQIAVTWPADAAAGMARFEVSDGLTTVSKVINQQLPPDDFVANSIPWEIVADGVGVGVLCEDVTVTVFPDDTTSSSPIIVDAVRVSSTSSLMMFVTAQLLTPDGDPLVTDPVANGDTIDFGNLSRDTATGDASGTRTVVIRNAGGAPLPLTGMIPNPGNGFSVRTPDVDYVPPGGELKVDLDFSGSSLGTFGSTFDVTDLFGVNLAVTVIDDDVPPIVSIVSPTDGDSVVEGSTILLDVAATDDVQIRNVELLVNGEVVSNDLIAPFEFDFTLPFLNDPQTPQSGEISFSATAFDQAGNATTSAPVAVSLTPADSPEVIVYPLSQSAAPFVDPSFELHGDVFGPFDIVQVEFLVDGVVVDTTNQEPYIGQIPQLTAASTITVVAVDIFGTEYTSRPLILSPPSTAITGQTWQDLNSNGVKDANEPGINGWTIEVVDGNGNVVGMTTSADWDLNGSGIIDPLTEAGLYEVMVPAGQWTVRQIPRNGWLQSSPGVEPLAQSAFDLDREFGIQKTQNTFENWGGLGEKWFYGQSNREWLFVVPDGGVFRWDGSGRDSLTGTKVGQLDSSYHQDISRIHDATSPGGIMIDVVSGTTAGSVDFGNEGQGAIEGRKWNDLNLNGTRDAGEVWLNGWTVTLEDDDGKVIATTQTRDRDLNNDQQIDPETEAGWYVFEQLGGGSFVVGEEERPGWTQTFPERQIAQTIFDLDSNLNFRSTRSDFRNWGGMDERWIQSNDGWHFIKPNGELFKWDDSPRTALTGTLVTSLSPDYWMHLERIHSAVTPGKYRVDVDSQSVSNINFGNAQQ